MRTGDPFEPRAGTAGLFEVVDHALSVPDPDRADDPSDGLLATPFPERSPHPPHARHAVTHGWTPGRRDYETSDNVSYGLFGAFRDAIRRWSRSKRDGAPRP